MELLNVITAMSELFHAVKIFRILMENKCVNIILEDIFQLQRLPRIQ